jgi:hypothetical protein
MITAKDELERIWEVYFTEISHLRLEGLNKTVI